MRENAAPKSRGKAVKTLIKKKKGEDNTSLDLPPESSSDKVSQSHSSNEGVEQDQSAETSKDSGSDPIPDQEPKPSRKRLTRPSNTLSEEEGKVKSPTSKRHRP